MLTAVRQLAAADHLVLVNWIADDVIELTESDPATLVPIALRAPVSWVQRSECAVLEMETPRRLLPTAIIHALPSPPAAACVVHGPLPRDGERGTSLIFVWLDRDRVPPTIQRAPDFLQHLIVGRTPQERGAPRPATAAMLDAIMSRVPQGVIFVDDSRGDALVNAAAAAQLNAPAGIITRQELQAAMQQLFARLKNRAFIQQEATRIAADPEARIDDWSWEFDDTEGRTLRVMSVPISGDAGHGRLWTFDDVSHERALLRQLSRHRAFEEKLRQVQKLELVGRLAASVAHDFNNLLTIISGSAEMLNDAPLDDERRVDLHNIEHATDSARRLTRQLLTFTRQQVEQSELFVLDDRLSDTASLLSRVLAPSAQLALELGAGQAQLYADPNQLELALLNLLANARDAMPQGGTVTLRTAVEHLVGDAVLGSPNLLSGTHVAISVIDTGSGFDAATRAAMFEPFFTTKPPGQGTGLGLATVVAIVQRAGGGLRCDSVPGAGATFTLLLPRANVIGQATDAGTTDTATAPVSRTFVLLVDDDPGPRNTLRRLLVHEGFAVEVADSGAAALRLLDARGADVMAVVTDYIMPEMNGGELLQHLRGRFPSLPAVVISGFTPDAGTAGLLSRLHAGFLAKPFTGRQLASAIRQQVTLPAVTIGHPFGAAEAMREAP